MTKKQEQDVIIIGGGPAGISAAIWCAELGLTATLIEENNSLGGQLSSIFNPIVNYPGILKTSATELSAAFSRQIASSQINLVSRRLVVDADLDRKIVWTDDGSQFSARAIILATGVTRRKLSVEGEDKFHGKGILRSGAGEKALVSGKDVVIVGGGDAALENAVILSEYARHVTVIHRRSEYAARNEFVEHAKSLSNVTFQLNTTVQSFGGDEHLGNVVLKQEGSEQPFLLSADFALIRIGVMPNTAWLRNQMELDPDGYIQISADGSTSVENVFAAGDVTDAFSPTIASAIGAGATAAKNILSRLRKS